MGVKNSKDYLKSKFDLWRKLNAIDSYTSLYEYCIFRVYVSETDEYSPDIRNNNPECFKKSNSIWIKNDQAHSFPRGLSHQICVAFLNKDEYYRKK